MKQLLIAVVALFGMVAQADEVAAPAWVCSLSGEVTGQSISIGLSYTELDGISTIHCESANDVEVDVPIRLKLRGLGVGLGFTDYKGIEVRSANVGVAEPEALVGSYRVGASAGLTLIEAGINFDAGLEVSKEGGVSFEVGLIGANARGLEAKIQMQKFEISPLE